MKKAMTLIVSLVLLLTFIPMSIWKTAKADSDNWAPEELVPLIGGIPKHISELTEFYNLSLLQDIYDQWDVDQILDNLITTGKCSLPVKSGEYDFCCISYYQGSNTNMVFIFPEVKRHKGKVEIILSEEDRKIPKEIDGFSISLSSVMEKVKLAFEGAKGHTNTVDNARQNSNLEVNVPETGWNRAVAFMTSFEDNLPEEYVEYRLFYDGDGDGYFVDLVRRTQNESGMYDEERWAALYDAAGERY